MSIVTSNSAGTMFPEMGPVQTRAAEDTGEGLNKQVIISLLLSKNLMFFIYFLLCHYFWHSDSFQYATLLTKNKLIMSVTSVITDHP